jgi:hypothetical protein
MEFKSIANLENVNVTSYSSLIRSSKAFLQTHVAGHTSKV